MLKLTSNEEKVRKELLKFPNGAKATQIEAELVMTKTPLYTALHRLAEKKLAFRGYNNLWYPNPPEKEQSTRVDLSYEKRLEAIRTENLSNPTIAFFDLLFFINTLPFRLQERLGLDFLIGTSAIMKANQWRPFEEKAQKEERLKTITSFIVLYFINKISMLLNEEFGTMKEK